MGRKRNIIKEFMGYYLQLGTEGRQVIRDLLAAEGLDFKGKQPLVEQALTSKPTAAATRVHERCTRCDKTKVHRFHKDSSDDGYHPFVPPTAAPTAQSPSPASNGAGSSTVNTETETAAAGVAAGGSNE